LDGSCGHERTYAVKTHVDLEVEPQEPLKSTPNENEDENITCISLLVLTPYLADCCVMQP
jgi:hypothetical protein